MSDTLENSCIWVANREECKELFNIARDQGFTWWLDTDEDLEILHDQKFPDILYFTEHHTVAHSIEARKATQLKLASDVLRPKFTLEDFIRYFAECECAGTGDVQKLNCTDCVMGNDNTKCGKALCSPFDWKGNEQELLSIVKEGVYCIDDRAKNAATVIQQFMDSTSTLTPELQSSLALAVDTLEKVR